MTTVFLLAALLGGTVGSLACIAHPILGGLAGAAAGDLILGAAWALATHGVST